MPVENGLPLRREQEEDERHRLAPFRQQREGEIGRDLEIRRQIDAPQPRVGLPRQHGVGAVGEEEIGGVALELPGVEVLARRRGRRRRPLMRSSSARADTA